MSSSSSSSSRRSHDVYPMTVDEVEFFRKYRSDLVLRGINMPNRIGPQTIREQARQFIVDERDDMDGYQREISRANHAFPSENRMVHLLKVIRSLKPGYRTSTDLRGVPLGYLCARLAQSERHSNVLQGLYLSGVLRDFSTYLIDSDPSHGGNKTVYRTVDQLHVKEFPLWKVDSFDPQDRDVLYGRSANMSFEKYLEECIATKGGSDLNCFFLWESCSIARRNHAPLYLERNVFVTRTAGLSHIITRSFETTFEYGDMKYYVFIPDGLDNCFHSAVSYAYLKRYEQIFSGTRDEAFYEPGNQEEFLFESSIGDAGGDILMSPYQVKVEFIEQLLEDIEKIRLNGNNSDLPNPRGGRTKDVRRRQRVTQHGFSMYEMNRRADLLVKMGSIVPLVYRVNGSGSYPYIKNYCTANQKKGESSFLVDDLFDFVSIFLMTDTGHILDPSKHKQYVTSSVGASASSDQPNPVSGLLHAIAIYPTIMENTFKTYEEQKAFVEELEKRILLPFMDAMYTESTYCIGGESYDPAEVKRIMHEIVEIQNERYDRSLTNTLIFHTKKEQKKGSLSRQQKRYIQMRASSEQGGIHAPTDSLVIAYDIETVYNDIVDESEMKRRVWEPFHHDPSILASGDLLPIDSQIPFCVQWAPLNLKDTPSYAARKNKIDVTVRVENYTSPDIMFHPPLSDGVTHISDIILQNVRVVYGDFMLGKCVNDFLLEVARFVDQHQYRTAYCYAHNGVTFDSYIILHYSLFPVKKILKTNRGILSMSIAVPVGEDGTKSVTIHFRDTRVHIAGSLKNICKSFKVPPEWIKLDFPITMVNSRNCYHPDVLRITEPYAVNDVLCLAFIVKKLNESIMESEWEPSDIYDTRPPIVQFLTCMSMVKAATLNHFRKTFGSDDRIACHAVDLPSIRHWIQEATMGGRVGAYARSYASPFWAQIHSAFLRDDISELQSLYQSVVSEKQCMRVLDVTSLYPFAQSHFPLPTGELRYVRAAECARIIDEVYCSRCFDRRTLCEQHRNTTLDPNNPNCKNPFVIVLVHNLSVDPESRNSSIRNMCGRKLYKTGGLEYSLETPEEIMHRLGHEEQRSIQAYTHVDLYWMHVQGYTFDILCGIGWSTSYAYSDFIKPAFLKRIEAKKTGNKIQSEMLKLLYNSAFGVTTQRDICESSFITNLPENLRYRCVTDTELIQHLLQNNSAHVGPDEELDESITFPSGQTYFKKRKKKHINEFYGEQSPMHIGAAIMAYSRHVMNLVMFQCAPNLISYTDTDSVCIAEHEACHIDEKSPGLICDRDDAYMGTYKNDHNEGPHNEPNHDARVVLSLIGTKKVKVHVTLNPKGEIKIFNTFKGLNPANHMPGEKDTMHSDYVEKMITDTLFCIGLLGTAPDVTVTHWKRDLAHGISISDHPQMSKSDTYLGHSQGTRFALTPQGPIEMFIPFGHPVDREGGDLVPIRNTTNGSMADDPRRLTALCAAWKFSNPDKILNDMLEFSEKYYKHWKKKNILDDPEFISIIEIFNKAAATPY